MTTFEALVEARLAQKGIYRLDSQAAWVLLRQARDRGAPRALEALHGKLRAALVNEASSSSVQLEGPVLHVTGGDPEAVESVLQKFREQVDLLADEIE